MADVVKQKPTPRQPAPAELPTAAAPAAPKKRQGTLVGLAALVVLLAAAGVFLYLTLANDWGGVRTEALLLVNRLDPDFRTLQAESVARQAEAEQALTEAQAKLEKDRQALDNRKAELDRRQAALEAAENELEPLYRRNLSEEKLAEIKQAGKIYEAMEAKSAADIMARLYDESYMAAILYYMSPETAAQVLSGMAPELAARVTVELLKN